MDNEELQVPEEKSYTQKEVDALIAKAVQGAVAKVKEKASKSSEDRIAELERELARRDNADYCRSKLQEAGIDPSLASLIYAASNEESDVKLETLSGWYGDAVENAVKDKIRSTPTMKQHSNEAESTHRLSLAERQARLHDNGGN